VIGILQGRLTKPWNGELQCFPKGAWEKEFELARACGFDELELFVEQQHNPENPCWSREGRRRLRDLAKQHGVAMPTLCADCFITNPIAHTAEARDLMEQILDMGFSNVVLPFFEKADLDSEFATDSFMRVAGGWAQWARTSGTELLLETSLPADKLIRVADSVDMGVCYDLGNTTALGHDVPGDIRKLGARIQHVHVKDKRRKDGANVLLGTGDTDFKGAFAALKEVGYAGDYTFETNRGDDPVATAKQHLAFVKGLLK
jgi:sugar phosphate isomerase/epimerase